MTALAEPPIQKDEMGKTNRTMTRYNRIVHILGALKAGGAERFVVDLLIAQKQAGLPVELVLLLPVRDQVGEGWAKQLEDAGVEIFYGPSPRFRPPTVIWLNRFLRQKDITLVLANSSSPVSAANKALQFAQIAKTHCKCAP